MQVERHSEAAGVVMLSRWLLEEKTLFYQSTSDLIRCNIIMDRPRARRANHKKRRGHDGPMLTWLRRFSCSITAGFQNTPAWRGALLRFSASGLIREVRTE